MPQFTGVIPPLLTPLLDDGRLDEAGLESIVEFQLSAGASGVFVLGSSGEAIYLPDDVRRSVVDAAVRIVAGRVPVLAGALDGTPRRVVDQIQLFAGLAIDGVVVTSPYYANLSRAEIGAHFRGVADASPVPVLAYDIPGNTGRKLPADLVVELLEDGVIAGLKDSSNVLSDFRAVAEGVSDRAAASLLTGADTTADLALSLGADGFVPGLANVRPDLFVDMLAQHRRNDQAAVAKTQAKVNRLSALYGIGQEFGVGRHASELGAMKHALVRGGVLQRATLSTPLSAYPEAALDRLFAVLDSVDGDA